MSAAMNWPSRMPGSNPSAAMCAGELGAAPEAEDDDSAATKIYGGPSDPFLQKTFDQFRERERERRKHQHQTATGCWVDNDDWRPPRGGANA
jgi:hypothetical protein